jgi:hypothetical protein
MDKRSSLFCGEKKFYNNIDTRCLTFRTATVECDTANAASVVVGNPLPAKQKYPADADSGKREVHLVTCILDILPQSTEVKIVDECCYSKVRQLIRQSSHIDNHETR